MRIALLVTGVWLLLAAPASALKLTPCKDQDGFSCGVLVQPLDHSRPDAAKVHLRFAVESGRAAARRPLLVALSGGPGQPGVAFATGFAESLAPALAHYRLAVIDQRGTGKSGVLNCPGLQKLGSLAQIAPAQLTACADRIGPRRAFYSTRDTVEDLDGLRVALGADKLALMGVSYGTFVAQQYARVHPDTTRALILDSVVGPDGVDPFLLDSYANMPRVLREQCARSRCRGVTNDPVADVGALGAAIRAGAVTGRAYDDVGGRRTIRYRGADELFNLLLSGDLNPYLQAALPAAISAALHGDLSMLLRLRKIGDGGPTKLGELSWGLNVTTGCEDTALPYSLTSPFDVRDAATGAALAGVDPADYAPFDVDTVLHTSYSEDCSRWPQDVVSVPSADPLPDVPTLILTGRQDMRTPMENAVALADDLPHASVVRVPGTGHDELDSDLTGCASVALDRFVRGRAVGTPCRNRTNQVSPFPMAPRSLSDFNSAPGVGGRRGQALFAVLDTATDARVTLLQRLYADLPLKAGGLHGGFFRTSDTVVHLHRYTYVPGLRVTGRVDLSNGTVVGKVRVDGPKGTSGSLRLRDDGGAVGRLGGHRVRYVPGASASAARLRDGALRLAVVARGMRVPRALATMRGWRLRP